MHSIIKYGIIYVVPNLEIHVEVYLRNDSFYFFHMNTHFHNKLHSKFMQIQLHMASSDRISTYFIDQWPAFRIFRKSTLSWYKNFQQSTTKYYNNDD